MKTFNVAIIGCGNVGGGTAKIIQETAAELKKRAGGKEIKIKKIITLHPRRQAKRHGLPLELFCSDKEEITKEQSDACIKNVLNDPDIDLVIETVGGSTNHIHNLHKNILKSGKHLVTANKAILAKHGNTIFDYAKEKNKSVGFEGAVCGAIPLIKVVQDSFTGDLINSITGIVNGTSNFVLSRMNAKGSTFEDALKLAQKLGYAELDPTMDINGMDAANKLKILIQLIYGIPATEQSFPVKGITAITKEDFMVAKSLNSTIKLIAFAIKEKNKVYSFVQPAVISNQDFLYNVNGATNAIKINANYSGEHLFVGQGAGSIETGSAVVSDVVFIAKHGYIKDIKESTAPIKHKQADFNDYPASYLLIIKTKDNPGVIGTVGTAIGDVGVNIENIAQSIISGEDWFLPVEVSKCSAKQLNKAVSLIKKRKPKLIEDFKYIPIFK
ncbi:Homoserine dehydrogenase [Elusimicrobium minutum Pei191]|uniref:Homoserine dehydrogenase n=1 Tax=Elusimicrobium minutum (strain Pei191) TaxID=445932 RepID=B2KBU1_ELUMP|nr:homoserine dehydrogenase [Elusimicrobium minutum]ACC97845.1 Homoserine dehydrogenase [Elusimicrobium minutum Pei191]